MPTTTRWGLRYPALTDTADVPRDIGNLAADLDGVAFDDQGLFSARPVSTSGSPGKKGRYYWATDQSSLYRDNGTGWDLVNPTAAVDAAAGVGSLRTLGTGALQAAPGNDARLSDLRTPLDASVTAAKIAAALLPSQGAGNSTEALRAIGSGAGQVVSGSDARLTDQRTPLDGSVTGAKVSSTLKPSGSAAAGTEALRALGTTASTAAAGNDSRLTDQRTPLDGSVNTAKIVDSAVTGAKLSSALRGEHHLAGVVSLAPFSVPIDGAFHSLPVYMLINTPPIPSGLSRQWILQIVWWADASSNTMTVQDAFQPGVVNMGFTRAAGLDITGALFASNVYPSAYSYDASATLFQIRVSGGATSVLVYQLSLRYTYV